MGSRLRVGRAGVALAATAGIAVMAAAPVAAEPAKGTLTREKTTGLELNIVGMAKPIDASLMHMRLADGSTLKVYCVEIHTDARHDQAMVERPWDSYPNAQSPFHANRNKINWVLHHGYPATSLDELRKLKLAWSPDGLEEYEAIAATQAAIWHFSDGTKLDESDPTAGDENSHEDANPDILALYKHLTADARDDAEHPTPVLEINPDAVEGKAGTLVGPFKVTTNGAITEIAADLPDDVEITDAEGEELKAEEIADGTDVFFKVPAGAEDGEGSFKLTTKSKVDVGRLFVGEDYAKVPAQSLIVAESEETSIDAEAKATWKAAPVTTTTSVAPTTGATTTTPQAVAPTTTPSVSPVAQAKNDLPDTGASILVPVLVGLGLLGAGAGALIYQRRRKSA